MKKTMHRISKKILNKNIPKKKIRVSLFLEMDSVNFFKKYAKSIGAKYQPMISNVLSDYVKRISRKSQDI
jgi:predicted DNA binding CopG/RHH family protein